MLVIFIYFFCAIALRLPGTMLSKNRLNTFVLALGGNFSSFSLSIMMLVIGLSCPVLIKFPLILVFSGLLSWKDSELYTMFLLYLLRWFHVISDLKFIYMWYIILNLCIFVLLRIKQTLSCHVIFLIYSSVCFAIILQRILPFILSEKLLYNFLLWCILIWF